MSGDASSAPAPRAGWAGRPPPTAPRRRPDGRVRGLRTVAAIVAHGAGTRAQEGRSHRASTRRARLGARERLPPRERSLDHDSALLMRCGRALAGHPPARRSGRAVPGGRPPRPGPGGRPAAGRPNAWARGSPGRRPGRPGRGAGPEPSGRDGDPAAGGQHQRRGRPSPTTRRRGPPGASRPRRRPASGKPEDRGRLARSAVARAGVRRTPSRSRPKGGGSTSSAPAGRGYGQPGNAPRTRSRRGRAAAGTGTAVTLVAHRRPRADRLLIRLGSSASGILPLALFLSDQTRTSSLPFGSGRLIEPRS